MTSRPPRPRRPSPHTAGPASAVLGDVGAPRHAVVLAPVMARWDHGRFFRQIAEPLLGSGHRVTVHDTLSLLREGDDLDALVDRWARELAPGDDPTAPAAPDVLVGNALGGAVVQALLAQEWTHRTRVLLLSGPTVADAKLNAQLERIASAVEEQGLPAALHLLEEAVRGPGRQPASVPEPTGGASAVPAEAQPPSPQEESAQEESAQEETAGRRLSAGLRLLHDADARGPVRGFPGPLLHLYGEQSLLVRREHLATGPGTHHGLVGIDGAGMRPHADRPDLTKNAIARYLEAETS